jgi:anthraniloyl-CoA monooxygenase
MRILIAGAGPAGLSFATLMARSNPDSDITVVERGPAHMDPGWGVTLRDYATDFLGLDSAVMQKLRGRACWYRAQLAVDLPYPPTDGLHTISRAALNEALVQSCRDAGVGILYDTDIRAMAAEFDDVDLVVAADGRNSAVRALHVDVFSPTVVEGGNRYAWLGVAKPFDTLTILLEDSELPVLAWAYKYTETHSTLIIETTAQTLNQSGVEHLSAEESCAVIGRSLAGELDGASVLHSGAVRWEAFPMISCARLRHRNVVLLGDAAHTTHFSQGFGTMFAFDDAAALHEALTQAPSVDEALERYEANQQPKIARFQAQSGASMMWSEQTVAALQAHDEPGVRAQIEARWPNNEMPQAPMRPLAPR